MATKLRTPTRWGTLTLPDGRTLAYAAGGDPDGFPVVALHGTTGCRLGRWPTDEPYAANGAWWITYDRAGYGRSTRHRGRRVVDVVADVAALADHLGLDAFGVTGGSGGGPHSLACAALLPDRVVRAQCAVGVAPYGPGGLDRDAFYAGMDPANIEEFGWAEAGAATLEAELAPLYGRIVARVAEDPSSVLAEFDLSEADLAALAQPERMEMLRVSVPEECVLGVGGWVDDDLAFLAPWGFDLAAIRIPVLVQYGRTDVLVPAAHGDWLAAHVPGATVVVSEEGGHLSEDPLESISGTVAWLRAGVVPQG